MISQHQRDKRKVSKSVMEKIDYNLPIDYDDNDNNSNK